MATLAAYVAIPAACKAVIDTSVTLLTAINNSRQVPWINEALRKELEICQQDAQLIKLRLDSTGLPATAVGKQALQDLQATLIDFNREAELLKGLLEPAPTGMVHDAIIPWYVCWALQDVGVSGPGVCSHQHLSNHWFCWSPLCCSQAAGI